MSRATSERPLALAVLISGGGTTLQNLLTKIAASELDAVVDLVISSSSKASGLEFAQQADIPSTVLRKGQFASPTAYSEAIFNPCRELAIDLVVMGGFVKHVIIPADFENRVINIHPGLIPAFCGKGFYGNRVHQAVLDYGAKVSGCTVHFVDNEYDHGPIILQRTVPVEEVDDADSLQQRVFEQECAAYPEAIRLFAAGRLSVSDRRVQIASQ